VILPGVAGPELENTVTCVAVLPGVAVPGAAVHGVAVPGTAVAEPEVVFVVAVV